MVLTFYDGHGADTKKIFYEWNGERFTQMLGSPFASDLKP